MGGEVLVSRLATFRLFVGWRARVCGALACAYAPERDGHRPSVFLKVAVRDTGRGVSLVVQVVVRVVVIPVAVCW